MREISTVFICFAGSIVFCFWTVTIMLAIKSGKGILSLFSRKNKIEWLSIDDTQAKYGEDTSFLIE
jgi:hypothetical protein